MAKEHSKLYENIKALCRYRDIRMQDIERGIYRQVGYLSRGSVPSAEELNQIAKMLNVTMDDLMNKDFNAEISMMNILRLVEINLEQLRGFYTKDECIRELSRIVNEVYG